ncbi:MAG: GDP-mannose 4,6-dehydratase [Chlamydiia bacterium]|nr:GDP-mannose 4,6-dehydratase [Chlamydiia bacterium]MCH9618470.1 GDP-mannose 4,6-dehydratase [Chlamydiia bacterium]MCH9623932.1 GDP-mannose 4,6-dehydratase [Chlamydiia bacterium]
MKRIAILFFCGLTSLWGAKTALIFGVTGQDGSYLSEFLLEKGYQVHGVKRRSSSFNTERIDHLIENEPAFHLHYGDLSDPLNVCSLIQMIQPDEIYNLGAQSHVKVSFEMPGYTNTIDGSGVLNILESIRLLGLCEKTKFYQASTSEMYGEVMEIPQSEKTPFYPRSPYGCSKVYGFHITRNYRESYGIHASNGILFNHESPRRGETFVTRKITRAVARIKKGMQDVLYLGNLEAQRDFGYAKDYVEGMWLMLQQETADDYVIGTGKMYSVRTFVKKAFAQAGITIHWSGSGLDEQGIDAASGKVVVKISEKYFRPAEVELLIADASKAREKLGWESKTCIDELVKIMITADLAELEE